MTELSYIIVSWNAKGYLIQCLESLKRFGVGIYSETLVVDNASDDGSADAVKEVFPDVKLIQNRTNVGFARANNQAIRECKGRYLALVNSDIEILGDCLARMLEYLDTHPRIGILGPRILNPDRTLQASCYRFPKLWRAAAEALGLHRLFPSLTYCSHERTGRVEALNGCFLMVRREALQQVGELDERFFMYAEDLDWCKRFVDMGWETAYLKEAEAVHYGGQSSANTPVRFYVEMQKANLAYYLKHRGRLAAGCYAAIVFAHQLLRVARGSVLMLLHPASRAEHTFKVRRSVACLRWLLRASEA